MTTRRILVVANRTAATHRLLDEVKRRASKGPCEFALLVPPSRKPDWTVETARGVVARAIGGPVRGLAGDDALAAAREFDEVIVSARASRVARRLHRDLVHRLRAAGVPVTDVGPRRPRVTMRDAAEMTVQADAGLVAAMPRWDELKR